MNTNKELEELKAEYENIVIPEKGVENMKKAIEQAKQEKAKKKKVLVYKRIGACAAAAAALTILIPNVSVSAAMAMEKIPVLGSIVRVITFDRYDFEDEKHSADVEVPQLQVENAADSASSEAGGGNSDAPNTAPDAGSKTEDSANAINQEITDYVTPILDEFKKSLDQDAVKDLTISYDVVTDTDTWFTLRINVLEVQASGYEYARYFHINKATGERAVLADLFREDADYVTAISENIKTQMREQMKADENISYFLDDTDMPETNFDRIRPDQNFYFNPSGQIVIAFDEYEAAPGYMGAVSFTIPGAVTDPLLR